MIKFLKKIPVECYTRVVGYFRPTCHTNPGKQEEIGQRKLADVKKTLKEMEKR